MNRLYILFLIILAPSLGYTQTSEFKNGFGINQDFHDYNVRLLDNKITSFDSSLSQSLRISYNRYLSRSWSVSSGISNGFLLNQTKENKLIRKSYLLGWDIDFLFNFNNGKWLPTDAFVSPFLSFGYNFNYLSAYKKMGLKPMVTSNEYGVGVNFRLGDKSKVVLSTALNQQLNGEYETHMQYRLGFSQAIGRKSTVKPSFPKELKDSDFDGVADLNDKCPDVAGDSSLDGCPSSAKNSISLEYQDSINRLIDDLEQMLLVLKSDVYNLSQNQVIEVIYSEPIVMTDDRKTEPLTETPVPVKENPIVKKKTEVDEKKYVDVPDVPEIDDKVNDEGMANTADSQTPTYKQSGEELSFYVIAISTKDRSLAENSAQLISKDYDNVRILPQPNGFYRVGIYATKLRPEAVKLLGYAKSHGIPSAWISYE